MAALNHAMRVVVRAPLPGEGSAVAGLWRELWDAHEQWGGYPGSREARVYAQLAARLDDDARIRAGHPVLGHHVHLVADVRGVPCGQVEGWFEQKSAYAPPTCEVRSLIVSRRARGMGAGRALLDELAGTARQMAHGSGVVLAAEVLDPNPARAFYARVGYTPVAWSARIEAGSPAPHRAGGPFAVRFAVPQDALALARLETTLASRRRAAGDVRFDRPHAIDATLVSAIASHLHAGASTAGADPLTLVAVDSAGVPRGAATFSVQSLEPPFLPIRRALLGRFALDPASAVEPIVGPLVAFGCRVAAAKGAAHVELTDLSAPGTDIYEAVLVAGARPWSRVVTRD